MDIGHCPACTRPYTASEVTGYGILRSRPAEQGGPIVEFGCPGCGRKLTLVPHGEGRYAPPGEPPPPAVPEADRRPPWVIEDQTRASTGPPPPPPRAERDPVDIPVPEADSPPSSEPAVEVEEGAPQTIAEALEVLGIGPSATERDIDRAFRERSRTCHPDKVAHLDVEFQQLAEQKFRRLLAAYELLRDQ